MGSNQYGSWDDKAMAALQKKQDRERRTLSDRQTAAYNKLNAKLIALGESQHAEVSAMRAKHMDQQEALVTLFE